MFWSCLLICLPGLITQKVMRGFQTFTSGVFLRRNNKKKLWDDTDYDPDSGSAL